MKSHSPVKHFYTLIILLCLAGCSTVSPRGLGISESDWEQYSPAKKDQLILAYEQTQQNKRAVHARAGNGVLAVRIEGGEAWLPPYNNPSHYRPISFEIRQGDCRRKIPVEQVGAESGSGKLEVCYKDDILYLDPSPYDPNLSLGSLQLSYMPIWKRGFTYPSVTSTGLLKLTNVHIYVHQVTPSNDN